jgi:hypothetical protein
MPSLEVIGKIRQNLTPIVTLRSSEDRGTEVVVEVKYEYRGFPFNFARVFKATADRQGNIIRMDDC